MKISKRKFYKTTYKVEILSEEPIPDSMELPDVLNEATIGSYSGDIVSKSTTMVSARQCAKALVKQGSDPGFFLLTETGADIEEGETV